MMPASRTQTVPEILWTEGLWHCVLQTGGVPGEGRLLVYRGGSVVTAESVHVGAATYVRADVLHQRVLRGDLRASE